MKTEIASNKKVEAEDKVEVVVRIVVVVVVVDQFVVISVTVHVTIMHLLKVVVMVLIVPSHTINRFLTCQCFLKKISTHTIVLIFRERNF